MEPIEKVLLTLIHQKDGQASWHFLATRLPAYDVPLGVNMMTVLRGMADRGLVTSMAVGGGMDRWSCTAAGRAILESPPDVGELIAAAHARDFADWIRALIPLADDGPRMSATLRRVLEADETSANRVAFGAAIMPHPERLPFALQLLDDARPHVRASFFRAWAPPRFDWPGQATVPVPQPELDRLLKRGLTDSALEVQEPAVACVFGAARGSQFVAELTLLAQSPDRHLRWCAVVALCTAPAARPLLDKITLDPDPGIAEAARYALSLSAK
jgi:hypothetical protein